MRYGVTDAPGVSLEVQPTPKPPAPGAVGTTVIFGVFERGVVGAPLVAPVLTGNKTALQRRRGYYVDDYFGPDAARHFLDSSKGAGQLYTVRVTDGTEVESTLSIYGRQPPRGVLFRQPDPAFNPVALSVVAKWGGRAGGKRQVFGGVLAALGSIAATTVATGKTMLTDEYAGGTLRLEGVSTRTYTVLSNTSAGVLTVASDEDMATDIAADDPTNLYWSVELENLQDDGVRKAIGLEVVPRGQRRPTADFGLRCYLDRDRAWDLADLAMVTGTGRQEVGATLDAKADNYEVDVTNGWSGSDDPLARPANWAGIIEEGGLGTNSLTLRIVEWRQTVGGAAGKGYVHLWQYGSDVREDTLTLTFTGATTYTVSSTLVEDIPAAGALGANNLHNLHPFLAGFTVVAGTTPFVLGDVLTIRVKPLLQDGSMRSALLFPDAAGANAAISVPVLSNTHNTVTVPASYDLTTYASEPEHAYLQTTVGPWDTTTGSLGGFTITGISDELASVIADFTVPGALALTAAQLVLAWEAHDARLWGEVQTDGSAFLGVQSTGSGAYFVVVGGTAVGAGPTILAAAGADWGSDGSLEVLQYAQEMGGGYDGTASLANSHMVSALDPAGSVAQLLGLNTGLVVLAAPGWTDPTVVAAGQSLAESILGLFVPDFPTGTTTEEAAKTLVSGTWGENDFYAPYWPSWGNCDRGDTQSRIPEYDVQTPLTGKVLGLQAYSWATFGYGKAPAGDYLTVNGVNRFLKANWEVPPDAEVLNKAGIRALTPYGTAKPLLWGDRMPGLSIEWLHKAACLYQVGKELLFPGTFRRFIFMLNDALTWADLKVAARALLEPHYRAGWFRRDLPGGFDDAVQIRIDSETTPESERSAGRAVLVVGVVLPDTLEQLTIKLSEEGVSV